MLVTSLSLRDFRNYGRAELDLGPGLNVVHGPNGAGKTNLLEAVYFALTGRSCRTSNEREVVRSGEQVTRVVADVAGEDGPHTLEVGFAPGEKEKRIRVDGAPLERGGAPPPRPLVCVFLPDRLELVKGAPASRRSHLDQVVTALWPARAETRSAYARALAQRNALVARVRAGPTRSSCATSPARRRLTRPGCGPSSRSGALPTWSAASPRTGRTATTWR